MGLVGRIKERRAAAKGRSGSSNKARRVVSVSTVEAEANKLAAGRPPLAPARPITSDFRTAGVVPAPAVSSVAAAERRMAADDVRAQLAQVHRAAADTARAMLQRGDRIDRLARRSDALQDVSSMFTTRARRVRRKLQWANVRLVVIAGAVLAFIVLAALAYYGRGYGKPIRRMFRRARPYTVEVEPEPSVELEPEAEAATAGGGRAETGRLAALVDEMRAIDDEMGGGSGGDYGEDDYE